MAELNGMQGNEIADDFTRSGTTESRWAVTWEVVKTGFWKLVVLNLLVLLTFAPGILVIYMRNANILSRGLTYPFNASVGYPFYPQDTMVGLAESVNLSTDILYYSLLIIAGFIASIGVSGATYCIRRMLNTKGEFRAKSFFHGIKVGYFNTLLPVTIFLIFLYITFIVGDWMRYIHVTGGNYAGAVTAFVFSIIVTVLIGLYSAWLFSVGVGYRVKLRHLFRNSFMLLIGTPLQTVLMAGFALIPVWLILIGGFVRIIGIVLFLFFGFSFILICWSSYSQWVFDLYITPAVKTEKEAARAQKSEKELAAEKAAEEKQQALELLAAGKSELIARPIMPISQEESVPTLGRTFTRAQISGAASSRKKLGEEVSSYEKQHENDPVYVEYNKMFAEREKALQEPEAKGKKKKKISADNLLK